MISADESRQLSKTAIETSTAELEKKLEECIQAAIRQGSYKSQFYARSSVESILAVRILKDNGFRAEVCHAKDPRDKAYILISWEN